MTGEDGDKPCGLPSTTSRPGHAYLDAVGPRCGNARPIAQPGLGLPQRRRRPPLAGLSARRPPAGRSTRRASESGAADAPGSAPPVALQWRAPVVRTVEPRTTALPDPAASTGMNKASKTHNPMQHLLPLSADHPPARSIASPPDSSSNARRGGSVPTGGPVPGLFVALAALCGSRSRVASPLLSALPVAWRRTVVPLVRPSDYLLGGLGRVPGRVFRPGTP